MYAGGKEIEYTHKDNLGKSGSIVTSLLDAYLDKGHILYVDNFYSSPALFAYLFPDMLKLVVQLEFRCLNLQKNYPRGKQNVSIVRNF